MGRDRLLLSDSAILTDLLQKAVFRRKNCRFFIAGDGERVWHLLEQESPDVILLDFILPGIDETLCRRIKADPRFREIPLVGVAHGRTREELRKLRQAGCDDVVVTPLRRNRLTWVVRRLLRLPLRQQRRREACLRVRYGTSPGHLHSARTLNLGTGGVLIHAAAAIPIDTPILVELFLPGSAPPIRCRGRVAWLGAAAGAGAQEMGIEFFGLSPQDKELIRGYIEAAVTLVSA